MYVPSGTFFPSFSLFFKKNISTGFQLQTPTCTKEKIKTTPSLAWQSSTKH
jgi:hypothetical protein